MDCYSEYKYNHYQQQHNIHHTYYNNNPSMRFGNTTNDNHHTQQQQPQFYDGFSRHHSHPHLHQPTLSPYNNQQHPHHLHHPSSAAASYPSSPFDANNESSSQFYYSSMHQTATAVSSSYYGNHLSNHHHHQNPYETYRSAPSNYRSYNYGYHNNLHYPPHFQGHFYPQYNGNHAPAPADHFNHYPVTPPSSTTNGTIPSVRVTSSQHQQQQEDFNAPSSSATATNLHSNEFSSTSMKNDLHEEQGSNKSIENETKQQQQDVVNEEEERVEQSQDIENNKNNDSEIKEIKSSPMSVMNEENSNVENEKIKESTNNNDNDNNNNNNNSTNRSVEEEQEVAKKLKNESSYNETENFKENHEDTSATGYTSEVNSRTNKNHRDNEKQGAIAHIGNDSRLPEHSNLTPHNFNDRSLTPIAKLSTIGYNHHYNNMELPHNYASPKHQRYPMSPWYSHDYYNNWILNPDDRRHFPDSQTFFSSMRNSKKNHHFYSDKLHKAQQLDTSPSSIKRTKRKAKVDESTIKKDTGKELIKNLTPLPGFLQTFGQTEIGKFSEAFYISSDSPHYQYNESDIDSPQPYDFDSLDGPIPKSFYICGSENDSPMSSFSEIMCKDF